MHRIIKSARHSRTESQDIVIMYGSGDIGGVTEPVSEPEPSVKRRAGPGAGDQSQARLRSAMRIPRPPTKIGGKDCLGSIKCLVKTGN